MRSKTGGGTGDIFWDPVAGHLRADELEQMDVVVHLAGESLAKRWTATRRSRIRESRVRGTLLLSETLARLKQPPRLLISASAIGYYGTRADAPVDERGPPGEDFLAVVVREWEAATEPARAAGIRVVHPRFGIVLSRRGGALARMLPFFAVFTGGRLGSGRQWMSWISLRDVVRAIQHLIDTPAIRGPVNLVAPEPVQNREFARTLGRVLRRPSLVPVPAFALKLVFGEMAGATVLASQRVIPAVLADSAFVFEHPTLVLALRHELRLGAN